MKNLLNNIWCVSALSLVAIGYFTFSVVFPLVNMFSEDDPSVEFNDSIEEIDGAQAEVHSEVSLNRTSVVREDIVWITELTRDPFVRLVEYPTPELGAAIGDSMMVQSKKSSIKPNNLQLPSLTALFHRATESVAVIDGKLLSIGETISGFQIRKINKSSVVVERNGQDYALIVKRGR